jgi:hypothetical protein
MKNQGSILSDVFADSGELPPFKAWKHQCHPRTLVTATTKKRAMDLAGISRHKMDSYWKQCSGSSWYPLAYEEGVWTEEMGENYSGNGVFYRPIARHELYEMAVGHFRKYQTMRIDNLINLIGQDVDETGESSMGTPYSFTASIRNFEWQPKAITVTGEANYCLNFTYRGWASIDQTFPLHKVDWIKEGF